MQVIPRRTCLVYLMCILMVVAQRVRPSISLFLQLMLLSRTHNRLGLLLFLRNDRVPLRIARRRERSVWVDRRVVDRADLFVILVICVEVSPLLY